jgi:hypothetical protein
MDFLIQVRWTNGSNQLLQRGDGNSSASITITPDDGVPALAVSPTESGVDFKLSSPSKKVVATVSFNPTVAGNKAEVLSANQTYDVSGTDLVENSATVGPTGSTTTVAKHPLLTLTKNRSATTGTTVAFTLKVNTDFVDATELWSKMLGASGTCVTESGSCWSAYQKLHQAGSELVVLGFTAGSPIVWFVVVPDACKSAGTVSSLVFFRPALYSYSTFDDPQHAAVGMFKMCRYLITPRAKDPHVWWAWDRYHDITPAQHATVNNASAVFYDWLCTGLEDALHRSGKKVILVMPLPVGTGFGVAEGPQLASHLASIRALLYARGKIGVGQQSISGNKLGLAGYSAGGLGLYPCLRANRALVNELYCFDPNDDDKHIAEVAQWAFETADFKLRLAGGLDGHVRTNDAVAKTVTRRIAMTPRKATGGVVTTHPASPSTFYAEKTGDKWYNHVFSEALPGWGGGGFDHGTRHQFVIYGGEDPGFTPGAAAGAPWNGVSFFEQFLKDSSL